MAIELREPSAHIGKMERAIQRPPGFKKPANWSNPPVPEPRAPEPSADPLDPTRFGDWEHKGIAVDF